MRLTTIGTGTAAPSAARVNAGHLVEAGDVRLLLDCGSGVAHRMEGLGLDWRGITHVALTHFHADHTSDLATLFVAWRWGQLPPRSAPHSERPRTSSGASPIPSRPSTTYAMV